MASTALVRTKSGAIYPASTVCSVLVGQLKVVLAEIKRYRVLIDTLQEEMVFETSLLPLATAPDFSFAAWSQAFKEISDKMDKLGAYFEIRTEMEKFADTLHTKLEALGA
jgi:hypothetical protein